MDTYEIQSDLLKTLSHATRLAILDILRDGEQCVCHLEATLGLWQAYISQQLMILNTHKYFLDTRERISRAYFVGNVHENNLFHIWKDSLYRELRKRLQDFDFSPCALCNSCEMANENLEDCFGNIQPTCSGCLRARGLIRCP